ncbi:MAG: Clp protease N-terminal domain-containing protein, partial [Pseudomonadota bacterium]|nr:Clp protease N-terminal domain-containing protein [Pseudomonadota bacterium]
MRIDRFTNSLQTALQDAQSLALGRDHQYIEAEHLLAAMLKQSGGAVKPMLSQAGANAAALDAAVNDALDKLPRVEGNPGDVHVSQGLARVFNISDKLSQQRGDAYISSELVVLAMLESATSISKVMKEAGVEKSRLESVIEQLRGGQSVNDASAEENRQALDKYTIDLTERAESGKLDPVIGRDDEIRRTIQVLQRRTKNNPVLIGEPGVGKTAIVEGLAQRIINGEVPEGLKDKRVLSLDLGALL